MSAALIDAIPAHTTFLFEVTEEHYDEMVEAIARLEKELEESDQAYQAIEAEAFRLRDEVAASDLIIEEQTDALEAIEGKLQEIRSILGGVL